MPIVFSNETPKDLALLEWWYNSLDCCVTYEVHEKLARKNAAQDTYAFERGLQGVALDMMLRGFRIDPIWKNRNIAEYSAKADAIQEQMDRLVFGFTGKLPDKKTRKVLNANSPDQLKEFFYETLGLPEVWLSFRGERRISTNREALEKLSDYYIAQPFINSIFVLRDCSKKLSMLRSGVDPDGRMRCTYNVCGTETGRWSSSKSVWGRGGNLQNVTDELRRMFIADPGYILVNLDGEQAESRGVGFIQGCLFDDWHYLDVCEREDLHTYVTKIVWPALGWTGEAASDRAIAEQAFYRHFTYRDMSKRGGHGTNYYGRPPTMAKHLKVPAKLIETFQHFYLREFPGFRKWWTYVSKCLTTTQSITTFVGRERTFFGRPDDDATLREAIAYEPQSAIGDLVNEGGRRVWSAFPEAQVLAQTHDSYTFQIPENRLDLIPRMIAAFEVPVTSPSGRTLVIPGEAQVGWNWAKADPKKKKFSDGNPDGLRKWTGAESRRRLEDPNASLLDRVLY